MEHYLEIVSVAKTDLPVLSGKGSSANANSCPQPIPTHPGLIISFKGRVFTAHTVLSKHATGSLESHPISS